MDLKMIFLLCDETHIQNHTEMTKPFLKMRQLSFGRTRFFYSSRNCTTCASH